MEEIESSLKMLFYEWPPASILNKIGFYFQLAI